MAGIGAPGVSTVEHEGQTLLSVVFRADVLFFIRAVGAGALAGIVNPAHQIVVVGFFADAGQVGGEVGPLHFVAFANGMASKTTSRFEQIFSVSRVAWFVFRQLIVQAGVPQIRGDGPYLIVV